MKQKIIHLWQLLRHKSRG